MQGHSSSTLFLASRLPGTALAASHPTWEPHLRLLPARIRDALLEIRIGQSRLPPRRQHRPRSGRRSHWRTIPSANMCGSDSSPRAIDTDAGIQTRLKLQVLIVILSRTASPPARCLLTVQDATTPAVSVAAPRTAVVGSQHKTHEVFRVVGDARWGSRRPR